MPLVSVVIPAYNRAATVVEAVESVLAQSWTRREIIVVDDGSTDATEEVLRPYRDRIRYVRRANGGFAAARNTGRAVAGGEFVAWLDSDDAWLPDKLEMQVNFMLRHPEVVASSTDFSEWRGGKVCRESHIGDYYAGIARQPRGVRGFYQETERIDRGGRPTDSGGFWTGIGDIHRELIWGNFVHPPTTVFRRTAMEEIGPQIETLANNSDYDYFLRLSRLGPFAYVDRPLLLYRYSDDQYSGPRHSLSLWLSLIEIMQEVAKTEPEAIAGREGEFRRRLGSMHLSLAEVQAEAGQMAFFRSLAHGMRLRPSLRRGGVVLAKAALPRQTLHWLRKLR